MPRVKKVKAGKDWPQFGIKKGEEHYVWRHRMAYGGITKRSKEYPTRSQLTMSDYLSRKYAIADGSIANATGVECLRAAVEEITELGEEQTEKLENMPEGLQQGSTGELLQERADECAEWASDCDSEIDGFVSDHGEDEDTEEAEPDEDEDTEEQWNEAFESLKQELIDMEP